MDKSHAGPLRKTYCLNLNLIVASLLLLSETRTTKSSCLNITESMAHIYEVGTRAWQPDPVEGWVASEMKEKIVDGDKVQLVFELENGEVRATPFCLAIPGCYGICRPKLT